MEAHLWKHKGFTQGFCSTRGSHKGEAAFGPTSHSNAYRQVLRNSSRMPGDRGDVLSPGRESVRPSPHPPPPFPLPLPPPTQQTVSLTCLFSVSMSTLTEMRGSRGSPTSSSSGSRRWKSPPCSASRLIQRGSSRE